jgi:glyceraldehyde-3-phosphate dehydrogenase/erythrose-4-phosphate dehydrogenase
VKQPCSQHSHPHRLVQQPLTELTEKLRACSRIVTVPRQAIIYVLLRHAHPLTNREIHAALGKADCEALVELMTRVTGCAPVMWGPSIVGFDRYHYRYASGHEGDAAGLGDFLFAGGRSTHQGH